MGVNKKAAALWLDQITGYSSGIGSATSGVWMGLFTSDATYMSNYWSNMTALASKELQSTDPNKSATYAAGYERVNILGDMNQCHLINSYLTTTSNKNVIYFPENYDYRPSGSGTVDTKSWPGVYAFGLFDGSTIGGSTQTLIAWGQISNSSGAAVVVAPEHVPLFRKGNLQIAFDDSYVSSSTGV